jgi:translation initiation factor IF-1
LRARLATGDRILVDLTDGQTVRCRVVNVKEDGTIQVAPKHAVVIR